MEFEVNDHVAVLDEALEGKILQVKGKQIVVETTEGFLMVFGEKDLVKLDKPLSQIAPLISKDVEEVINEKEQFFKNKKPKPRSRDKQVPPMEVDLHIHKLVDNTRGMTNHEMLNLQLETAERQLKFAIEKKIQRVVFIHGVGEGVLRTELEYLLSRYDNVNYYDANYQKYGVGATEVYIMQNA